MQPRSERIVLAAVVALAAALRFIGIGEQSFWLDEAFTVDLVDGSFGDMLSGVAATESTPPLYYLLAWLWEKPFGHGEAGLRSLSALIGVATVPATWAAARAWLGERAPHAPLIAAALVAVNPYFVWYSQEARSYSLLVLTAVLSLWALARALERQSGRPLALWAIAASLGLATHYFAGFLLLPEAVWLLWRLRSRAALAAVGAVGLAAAALAPLALHQRSRGHTTFIEDLSLSDRLADLPRKLVTGELGTPTPGVGPLAGLLVAAAAAYALAHGPRPPLVALAGIAAGATLVPLLLVAAGADYLLPRNLIAIYVPVVIVVAAGFALAPARLGLAAASVVCAVAVLVNVQVTSKPTLQRDDWRGAGRLLGPAPADGRAVVLTPDFARKPLRLYAPDPLPALPAAGAPVREVVVIGNARPPRFAAPPPPPGFAETGRKLTAGYLLIRYAAPAPRAVAPAQLAPSKLGPKAAAILLQTPRERNP